MAKRKPNSSSSIMPLIKSFPPVASPDARILILGSMPGITSLEANQYYAHPRNLFWIIMDELIGVEKDKSYEEKLNIIQQSNIALWDVLQSCIRKGSLDSSIKNEHPNDLLSFLKQHKQITTICFNGAKAEASFNRYLKTLENTEDITNRYQLIRLPSTSPANASISFKKKLSAWKQAIK